MQYRFGQYRFLAVWIVLLGLVNEIRAQGFNFTTLAGTSGVYGQADGVGGNASFRGPSGVALDALGNLYIADTGNQLIRKVSASGVVTTWAGGLNYSGSVDGPGTASSFQDPRGLAADALGNIYVADWQNHLLRKISSVGVVSTVAGSSNDYGSIVDGLGSAARFATPDGIAVGPDGNIYVGDAFAIRKVTPGGLVSTLAGSSSDAGTADGIGGNARFGGLLPGIAIDGQGNLYVSDSENQTIRKITPSGSVSTVAGSSGAKGFADGIGAAARFNQPGGIAVDPAGNLYVADTGNDVLRKIAPDGTVATIAGVPGSPGATDGIYYSALFTLPAGIVIDPSGNLFVTTQDTLRKGTFDSSLPTQVAPTIQVQPQDITSLAGHSVQLSVAATGTETLTYQWFKDGAAIVGATSSTLALGSKSNGDSLVTVADAGSYLVVVTNNAGTISSSSATVVIHAPPLVTTQPAVRLTPLVGQSATFSVVASGTAPLSYQWTTDTGPIPGATGPSLTLTNVQSSQSGTRYSVSISNAYGAVSSESGVLSVYSAPVISSQPEGLSDPPGINTAVVVHADGNPAPTIQWFKNGTAIAGATQNVLLLINLSVNDAGTYTAVATNVIGSVTSASAVVTVGALAPPVITSPPQSVVVALGGNAVFNVGATGPGPLTYAWSFPGLTNTTGGNTATLTVTNVAQSDVGIYRVTVSNSQGFTTAGDVTLTLQATNSAPFAAQQPQSQSVALGAPAQLTFVANGSTPIVYQWYKDSRVIAGATAATYSVAAAQLTDAGTYYATATNSLGSITSPSATLTVSSSVAPTLATQPSNLVLPAGSSATFSVTAAGNPAPNYQWYFNGTQITGANSSTYVLGSVGPVNAGLYSVKVSNSAGAVTSGNGSLAVTGANGAPVASFQPSSQTVSPGSTAVLEYRATSGGSGTAAKATVAVAYQWYFNDTPLLNATNSLLVIPNATAGNSGSYFCLATSGGVSTKSSPVTLAMGPSGTPGRLVNLSVLAPAGSGANTLTVGFVSGGASSGSQNLLVRAGGPSLGIFGVAGVLADPQLTVFNGTAQVAQNDDWGLPFSNQNLVANLATAVSAFPYGATNSADAALALTLPISSGYSAQVTGKGDALGMVLAEVYDANVNSSYVAGTPRLINLSCISNLSAGTSLTAGFVVGGATAKTLLIRGIGPALRYLGVGNGLADPQLILHHPVNGTDTILNSNSGWGGSVQITAIDTVVAAFALQDNSSNDSVIVETLAPGSYSAEVRSVSGGSGTALVEVYEVP